MTERRIYNIIIFAAVLFFSTLNIAYSYEDDGFGSARKIESAHFTIFYSPKLDSVGLAQQLNISPAEKILVGGSIGSTVSSDSGLADMLDTLFARVCDVLDMQLYSYKGTIKICRDYDQLNEIYRNLFDIDLKGIPAFYVYNLNTVYISAENFKCAVLGHEIAHAIISHYFVVQPSMKIQEVLAGYVKYQLRKPELK